MKRVIRYSVVRIKPSENIKPTKHTKPSPSKDEEEKNIYVPPSEVIKNLGPAMEGSW